ncbi:MAG: hypothetical protein HY521_02350 [Proteobacteria bacterium]|nr:hypothetical protein [Pseudomonadota bacterium]
MWFFAVAASMLVAACSAMQPLPDAASMDSPSAPDKIVVIPEFPTPGKRYVVERDGEQEVWLVKDNQGTLEFLDQSSQQLKFSIKLGPCFSFEVMRRPGGVGTHDFGAMGKPAYHTAPPDCRVWDGRTWTQTYAVQMPRLSQPCYYGAQRKAKIEGPPGDRLVTSDSWVVVTGPGVRGGSEQSAHRIVYSEKLQFFKELSPGYIGRRAIILRELE